MKGSPPPWLQEMLGIDPAESGEGTVWSLDHSWSWPPGLTVAFVVGVVLFLAWLNRREGRNSGWLGTLTLLMLRLGAVAIALLMLSELVLSRQRTGLPYVVVVVDDSASMGTVDRYDDSELRSKLEGELSALDLSGLSRINLAKSVLLRDSSALLNRIESRYKLRLYFASTTTRLQTGTTEELSQGVRGLEANGDASKLGEAIRVVLDDLRGTPPSAVIVLTDGVTTEGPSLSEAAVLARRKNVPLFTVAFGSQDPLKNIRLHDLLVDEDVFVNDVVNFDLRLTPSGFEGKSVNVLLRERDKPEILAQTRVRLGPDNQPQRVTVPYRPTTEGDFRYIVEVETLPDEDQKEDNAAEREVHVHRGQLKVLLVQAYPNYEYRYLKHLLERDSTVELRVVLQESDLQYSQEDRSALQVFPVRKEKQGDDDAEALYHYDALIFGDVNPAFLSSAVMQNIHDFVTVQGRGMLVIAGPQFTPTAYRDTPLSPLMPVDVETLADAKLRDNLSREFQVQPTELGISSPHMQLGDTIDQTLEIWRNLPGLYWLHEAPRLRPAARVLAEHPVRVGADGKKLPVFVEQYAGKGKVLYHATDETWRWRYRVGDALFARYWVQALRYLSRNKLRGEDEAAELITDRREYRRGDSIRFRVQFIDERQSPSEDDGVELIVERSGHTNQKVKLRRNPQSRGVFEGVMASAGDGSYHAWVATPAFSGGAPTADFSVMAPPGELRQLAVDLTELKTAASLTKGRFYAVESTASLLDDLPEGRQVPIESLEPVVLWNRWPLVLLFVALLIGEWMLRKRRGLL